MVSQTSIAEDNRRTEEHDQHRMHVKIEPEKNMQAVIMSIIDLLTHP